MEIAERVAGNGEGQIGSPARRETAAEGVLCVGDGLEEALTAVLVPYGLQLERVPDAADIPASFWGAPEAGIAGTIVYVRSDTPAHSVLHEAAHYVCASPQRRATLYRDAGSDDAEETAVCYLQIELAARVPGLGRDRLMQDMDRWGYSFRLGSTARWYRNDSADARAWLLSTGVIDGAGQLAGTLRTTQDPPAIC